MNDAMTPPGLLGALATNESPHTAIITVPTWFPGVDTSVAQARDWARWHLGDHPLEYNVRLVLSELATNAIQHTDSGLPGGGFWAGMSATDHCVRVSVQDQGARQTPTVRAPIADDAENGRGLAMVNLLTEGRWGTHHIVDRGGTPAGRVIWAELR